MIMGPSNIDRANCREATELFLRSYASLGES